MVLKALNIKDSLYPKFFKTFKIKNINKYILRCNCMMVMFCLIIPLKRRNNIYFICFWYINVKYFSEKKSIWFLMETKTTLDTYG